MKDNNFQTSLPTLKTHTFDEENQYSFEKILMKTFEISSSINCRNHNVIKTDKIDLDNFIKEPSFAKDVDYNIQEKNNCELESEESNHYLHKINTVDSTVTDSTRPELLYDSLSTEVEISLKFHSDSKNVNNELNIDKLQSNDIQEEISEKYEENRNEMKEESNLIIDLIIERIVEKINKIITIENYEIDDELLEEFNKIKNNKLETFETGDNSVKVSIINNVASTRLKEMTLYNDNIDHKLNRPKDSKNLLRLSTSKAQPQIKVQNKLSTVDKNRNKKKKKLFSDNRIIPESDFNKVPLHNETLLEQIIPRVSIRDTQPWSPVYIKENNIWPQLLNNYDQIKSRKESKINAPQKDLRKINKQFFRKRYENEGEFKIPEDGILGRDINESKFVNFCCNTCNAWISLGNRDQHLSSCIDNNEMKTRFSESLRKSLKPKTIMRMPGIVCFICGGRFTMRTINKHEKLCLTKWIKYNKQFNHFRPLPLKPEIIDCEISLRIEEEVKLGNVDFTREDAVNEVYYNASRNHVIHFNN